MNFLVTPKKSHIFILGFCGFFLVQKGCKPQSGELGNPGWYGESRELYFGIPVRLTFFPRNDELAAATWNYLYEIDTIFNDYKKDSEIGKINHSPGNFTYKVSPSLSKAFQISLQANKITKGAFDITIGPLRTLWKEAEKKNERPTKKEIAQVLNFCGLDKVTIMDNQLKMESPFQHFDFGGIIKGIAVDHVSKMLRTGGCSSYLIQIGGETAAFGPSVHKRPYTIGIQHPINLGTLWTTVKDQGQGFSLSTSGNYQQPIMIEDTEYYHILNPKTGIPVDTNVLSVSVYFRECGKNWLADSLSTSAIILGPEKAIPLITKRGGEILFLAKEGNEVREIKSPGWDQLAR